MDNYEHAIRVPIILAFEVVGVEHTLRKLWGIRKKNERTKK